jgi:hypothetical protein
MGKAKTIKPGIFNNNTVTAIPNGNPDSVTLRTKSNSVSIANTEEVNNPIPKMKGTISSLTIYTSMTEKPGIDIFKVLASFMARKREQGTGNREQGTGSRGAGSFGVEGQPMNNEQ